MLVRYLIFCLGCGLIQAAGARSPTRPEDVLDVPPMFMDRRMRLLVLNLSYGLIVAELVMGFLMFGWVGLVIWLPFGMFSGILFPGNNPGPPFWVGILVLLTGSLLLVFARF